MKTAENTIELETYRAKDSKVFTGRDRGEDVRKRAKIDELSERFNDVYFVIPKNIYSINPSFFEELFVNVVQKLGRDEFLKRFHFESLGDYSYEKSLHEAIDRILRERTGLDI